MSQVIEAYHGTDVDSAQKIIENNIVDSGRKWRWLGKGLYFFVGNRYLAGKYALLRLGLNNLQKEPAIIRAEIKLEDCMDILNPTWHEALRRAAKRFPETQKSLLIKDDQVVSDWTGEFRDYGKNELDYLVVEHVCEDLEKNNFPVKTVRNAFVEGKAIYGGSHFYSEANVRVAVRPPYDCIVTATILNSSEQEIKRDLYSVGIPLDL